MRQNKLNLDKLRKKIEDFVNAETTSILFYFFDKHWSEAIPPKIFVSCFLVKKDFNGKKISYRDNSMKSFFLIALREDQPFSIDSSKLLKRFNGVFGYEFKSSKYAYDGETNFEWAHNNIPIKIKDGQLENWEETTASKKLYFSASGYL